MENVMEIISRCSKDLPVDMPGLISELGMRYVSAPLETGTSGRVDHWHGAFVITINSNEGVQRGRFTAAHELAHYILHRDLIPAGGHADRLFDTGCDRSDGAGIEPWHEVQANQFAVDLLMPADRLSETYDAARDNYAELAKLCAVSRKAMKIRLKSLGLRASVDVALKGPAQGASEASSLP